MWNSLNKNLFLFFKKKKNKNSKVFLVTETTKCLKNTDAIIQVIHSGCYTQITSYVYAHIYEY